jgi:cysteine desulfurase / selenocysteine lyase
VVFLLLTNEGGRNVIYFDQAASTFPKPQVVVESVTNTLLNYSANPGRGNHKLARETAQIIEKTREKLADFFGASDVNKVIFYQNATTALNQAIKGFPFQKGDHVISTAFEHNAVRRPLEYVKREKGITITYIAPNEDGEVSVKEIAEAITSNTKCIVATHGSNVTGAITPIAEIGALTKRNNLTFIVDSSQTAGVLPINMQEMNINMLAFTGHKGLLAPQGIGGLIVEGELVLTPLIHGGTGSYAELDDQPHIWPNRYESGTLNSSGIAGLSTALDYLEEKGLQAIYEHEWELTKYCIEKLQQISDVQLFGPPLTRKRLAVVPFIINGVDAQEIAIILDQHFNIAVRAGKQCAPLTHDTLGTSSGGTVRVSFSISNSKEEIDTFIAAIQEIRDGMLG